MNYGPVIILTETQARLFANKAAKEKIDLFTIEDVERATRSNTDCQIKGIYYLSKHLQTVCRK